MRVTEHRADAHQYPPGWLVGQLPVGMRDDDLLVRFTTIFERIGATLRAGADGIEHIVDPTVTTPGMLALLGTWLGYDVLDDDLPIDRQRRIVTALGRALPWRGTAEGLRLVLEAITGGPVEIDDPGCVLAADEGHQSDGRVVVRLGSTGHLRHHELVALVRDEVPAHLGVDVVVSSDPGSETP
ncbi:phage tail protein [Nitriliruptor alkaliphilus]|uniref:phage tail protein n=1 Tax=Nitriliruptor alkaliphilus TaxID=427918 RepID=UPI0012EE0676|nr:phage tail protein [Nitriliruptor alkaliphilus]